MMGRRRGDQRRLFYEFHLDDRIPKNHLLRRIDVFVTAALAASIRSLSRTTATSAVHPSSAARRSARGSALPIIQPWFSARTAALRSGSLRPPRELPRPRLTGSTIAALLRVCDRRRPVRDRHHLLAVRQQYLHGKLQHDHHAPHGDLDHDRPRPTPFWRRGMACPETARQGEAASFP